MNEFPENIFRVMQSAFPGKSFAGTNEIEFAKAEEAIKCAIPRILKSLLQIVGGEKRVMLAHSRLYSVDKLERDDTMLIFGASHQLEVFWGLSISDCNIEDPPVYEKAANGSECVQPPFLSPL